MLMIKNNRHFLVWNFLVLALATISGEAVRGPAGRYLQPDETVGQSVCTYSPDYDCYLAGWPKCCDETAAETDADCNNEDVILECDRPVFDDNPVDTPSETEPLEESSSPTQLAGSAFGVALVGVFVALELF